jgi:hypothetical protein
MATRHARSESVAMALLAAHQNQIHLCTSAWNSLFAVDDSNEIPHGDDDATTGHSNVHGQFKVRHEQTKKV